MNQDLGRLISLCIFLCFARASRSISASFVYEISETPRFASRAFDAQHVHICMYVGKTSYFVFGFGNTRFHFPIHSSSD